MFDLQPGVHFQKEKFLTLGVEQELYCTSGKIFGRCTQTDRCLDEFAAHIVVEIRRWRFFDDLLVPSL